MLIRATLLLLLLGLLPRAFHKPQQVFADTRTIVRPDSVAPSFTPEDRRLLLEKLTLAVEETDFVASVMSVARSFCGTPYVSGTLDNGAEEQLTVNLRELDCWTFVENSIAIALITRGDAIAEPEKHYAHWLQQLRYYDGSVNDYASRIHYFSGWLLHAEALSLLENLTQEMGGKPWKKRIAFMSSHPERYPRLSKDPERIRAAEEQLSRHSWSFIPQQEVAAMEHLIQEGDIIAITSSKAGLDIAHEGFAVRSNGRIYLLHASSLGKRVVVSSQPLADYLLSQKGQTGIMVARLKAP